MRSLKILIINLLLIFTISLSYSADISKNQAIELYQRLSRRYYKIKNKTYERVAPRQLYKLESLIDQAKKLILKEKWKKAYYISGRCLATVRLIIAKKKLSDAKNKYKRIKRKIKSQ